MSYVQQVCNLVESGVGKNAAEFTQELYSIGGGSMAVGVTRIMEVGRVQGFCHWLRVEETLGVTQSK